MPLEVKETAHTVVLADKEVVVAGDWHGSRSWISHAIPAAAATGSTTMLHLGDFGLWPGESADLLAVVDYWARHAPRPPDVTGIEPILITPGNHEDWDDMAAAFAVTPTHAVRVSETAWLLPRAFRFTVGGRSLLSFGGAASIDYRRRVPLRSWWPAEMPAEEDVERAVAGGEVDILLSHDAGNCLVPAVAKILAGPSWLSLEEEAYSASSRARVQQVINALNPGLQLHAHWHVRDSTVCERDGHRALRVECMGTDDQPGNLGLLSLDALAVTDIEVTP